MNNMIDEYINKWIPLLQRIQEDEILLSRCKRCNPYIPDEEYDALIEELHFHEFLKEAYDSGIVVPDYMMFTDGREREVDNPSDTFIKQLSYMDTLRCIAYIYRRDHYNEGSLISEAFVNGSLLKYFRALKNKK